ncbi:MAG: YdcF family protein [Polyangia bacterium]
MIGFMLGRRRGWMHDGTDGRSRTRLITEWLARTFAFFLGFFLLLTLGFGVISFHTNLWWFDLTLLPSDTLRVLAVLLLSLGLLSVAWTLPRARWHRAAAACVLFLFLFFAGRNVVTYYVLLRRHLVYSAPLIPFSLLVFAGLLFLTWTLLRAPQSPAAGAAPEPSSRMPLVFFLAVHLALGILFPIAQIFCFGRTDYRRAADAIVVFGARTYADGTPSTVLANRVLTGCELYHKGYARLLLFSGGPGDGAVHETEAMRALALRTGVRPQDMILDREGLNTQATVANTRSLFAQRGLQRILVVSDFTHLPRIKLTYQLAGQQVFTVPVRELPRPSQLLFQLGRETAAFWTYYFRMGV